MLLLPQCPKCQGSSTAQRGRRIARKPSSVRPSSQASAGSTPPPSRNIIKNASLVVASEMAWSGDIYVQTKFTSVSGQDPKSVPYDLRSSITEQVTTSVASSLRNLAGLSGYAEEAFVDCLVLHSPFPTQPQTAEAWRAMEAHVPHSARTLGISNVYHLPTLRWLYEFAIIKPAVVQNRFYRETNYDIAIRAFCAENGMVYQSFWTLTANPQLVRSKLVGDLAEIVGVSSIVALYALVSSLGNVSILNVTTNARHLVEDLVGLSKVAAWANTNDGDWKSLQVMFAELLRV